MTTIVFKDGAMASDGMVSSEGVAFMLDAEKVKKIQTPSGELIVGLAGDYFFFPVIISALEEMGLDFNELQPIIKELGKDSSVLVYNKNAKKLIELSYTGWIERPYNKPYSIGSGSNLAMLAMDLESDLKKVLKSVIKRDLFSGGKIRVIK